MVKNLPAAGSTPGSGGSPPWRRELLTNQVFLPGKFHDRGTRWAIQSMGSQRVGHDWVTNSSTLQVYDMWVKEKSGKWPRNPTITYKIISLGKICFTHSLQNSQYMYHNPLILKPSCGYYTDLCALTFMSAVGVASNFWLKTKQKSETMRELGLHAATYQIITDYARR